MSEENVFSRIDIRNGRPLRRCRTCRREWARQHYQEKKVS